jgi:PAT family beta-lactamase induction signal transducer AmpG
MLFAIHLPDAVFIYMAHAQPTNLPLIQLCIAVEQFGYGFGFTAYMVYMLMVASQDAEHRSSHYAICTGFMALGMMLPGMAAGWLQAQWGYTMFFVWVCVATLPSFAAAALLKIDPAFGRRDDNPGS